MTFSSRVHESSVQFVDPHQSAAPSRTANLWCMRSPRPSISRTSAPVCASRSGRVCGGVSGCAGGSSGSWTAMRTRTPRARAAPIAAAISSPTGPGMRTS